MIDDLYVLLKVIPDLFFSNGPAAHVELVEKMGANVKKMQRAIRILSKESALLEVEKFRQKDPQPKYFLVKKSAEECDANEFQNNLLREMKAVAPNLKAVIIFMEDKPTSQLLVSSADEELLNSIASSLCETLEIKLGAGGLVCKNGRFQAKFTNAKNIKKCDQLVEELIK